MPPELPLLLAGAFSAALAVGVAGFADALILNAIWLQVLPPREAVPLVMASGLLMQGASSVGLRLRLERGTLVPLVVAGILGVPLGVLLLEQASPRPYRLALGVLLIAYCAHALLRRRHATPRPASTPATVAVGLTGGVLGGFAGLSGVLPTVWAGMLGWPRERQRGLYQPFIFAMHGVGLAWLGVRGLLDFTIAERVLWCLPALAAGLVLGHRLYAHIDERHFRLLVVALLALSGVALLRP